MSSVSPAVKRFADNLSIELQYAFVAPSDELVAINYLDLQQQASPVGYHVPRIVFEQSKLLLRPSTYHEIVEERCALKLCGLPTCGHRLQMAPDEHKTYLRLNLHQRKIFTEKDSSFCSSKCAQTSNAFESELEDVAIHFKAESLEKIKQTFQLIFNWYKAKIRLNDSQPAVTPTNSSNTDMNVDGDLSNAVRNLEIVEKNVDHLDDGNTDVSKKQKKWKRPTLHQQKHAKSRAQMQVDDDDDNDDDDNHESTQQDQPITMTGMERLFRLQQEEKQKKEQPKPLDETQTRTQSKDVECQQAPDTMSAEEREQVTEERQRMETDEKYLALYNTMSDNAQLMGYYISWVTDATTYFLTDAHRYSEWRSKALHEFNEQYSSPVLKQRQESLLLNVIKYVKGVLQKCGVNASLSSAVCNETHSLVETFDICSSIPSFTAKTWCFVAFVFLKLLSHRNAQLRRTMFDDSKSDVLLSVLKASGYGPEYVTTFEQIVVF